MILKLLLKGFKYRVHRNRKHSEHLQAGHLVLSLRLRHGVQHHPNETDNAATSALLMPWTSTLIS